MSSASPALNTTLERNQLTIQEHVAPFFFGVIVSYFFWGVQITQSYYYYRSYRTTDRPWLKTSVALLFIADAIDTVCVSAAAWGCMVSGWGDPDSISLYPGWGVYAIPLVDAFIASTVHFFYAQKIWTLFDEPHNFIWTAVVLILSCMQLVGGTGSTAIMFVRQITFAQFTSTRTWAGVWLVTAAVTDIVIAALMSAKLSKSRTGYKETDDIISMLIRLTVETGLATAIVQIVALVVALHWMDRPYHIILSAIAPKVYSNSMLALLNSRKPRTNKAYIHNSQHARQHESIRFDTSTSVVIPDQDSYELDNKAPIGNMSPSPQLGDSEELGSESSASRKPAQIGAAV